MLKLYKQVGNEIHYWETWDQDKKTGIIHWGVVGDRGQDKSIKSGSLSSFRKEIQIEINKQLENGYREIDEEDLFTLLIEYKVIEMGTPSDVEKRTRLQSKMDEVLGWTGLGHCDGGSIGSGTMEVCCVVVDFEIAKNVIETELDDTEFSDYIRIFDENAQEN